MTKYFNFRKSSTYSIIGRQIFELFRPGTVVILSWTNKLPNGLECKLSHNMTYNKQGWFSK